MADGGLYWTPEETEKFKEAFSFIAPAVEEFARKYNLKIEKYYYGGPKWNLFFARRIGGIAQIYIDYLSNTKCDFIIGVMWHVDDYDAEIRHAKHKQIGGYSYDKDIYLLFEILEKSIETIKIWKMKDLDRHYDEMISWKRHWRNKEDFEQSELKGYSVLDI